MTDLQQSNNMLLAEALESGRYTQTQGTLRQGDSFDCLGVACEVYRYSTGSGTWTEAGAFLVDGEKAQDGLPPLAVAKWYGWTSRTGTKTEIEQNPTLPTIDGLYRCSAAEMNDSGVPFQAIGNQFRQLVRMQWA